MITIQATSDIVVEVLGPEDIIEGLPAVTIKVTRRQHSPLDGAGRRTEVSKRDVERSGGASGRVL